MIKKVIAIVPTNKTKKRAVLVENYIFINIQIKLFKKKKKFWIFKTNLKKNILLT
jgi:hypothetical protein